MTFTVVKKGTRPSTSKIYISAIAKTITFSAGFCRSHGINLKTIKHIRLAYDKESKEIAIEFPKMAENENELLKLSFPAGGTTASSSINPIIATFSINIKEIAGTYKEDAIDGPIKIDGFANKAFILKTKLREVKQ